MHNFLNDYSEGAHENILRALYESNHGASVGYGLDEYCKAAKELILNEIDVEADIHFVSGGTLANILVISHVLKPYEAVVAASSGHINVHEAGSIENSGHKILTVTSHNGKIDIEDIDKIVKYHHGDNMVIPKMIYISNVSELGSAYNKEELKKIYEYCQINDLYLFIDGARLANALCDEDNNLSLKDVARYSDVFYFGGTKNGALFGEAIIFRNLDIAKNFRYTMKQKGAILAKGRILGIQFRELFKDQLYLKLAKYANNLANKIENKMLELDIPLLLKTNTNQIFPILENDVVEYLAKKYLFEIWEEYDNNHKVVRFVTSWDAKEEAVISLLEDLDELYRK